VTLDLLEAVVAVSTSLVAVLVQVVEELTLLLEQMVDQVFLTQFLDLTTSGAVEAVVLHTTDLRVVMAVLVAVVVEQLIKAAEQVLVVQLD
jgi:hypothetical protein